MKRLLPTFLVCVVMAACSSQIAPPTTSGGTATISLASPTAREPIVEPFYATQSARLAICGSLDKLGMGNKPLSAGAAITGPASIHPNNYYAMMELGGVLGLPLPLSGGWGLTVHSGRNVEIPQSLQLIDDSVWEPDGLVVLYESEKQLDDTIICWMEAHSP